MSFAPNAIIARMGLDLNGLKGDLTAAEKLAVRSSNQIASEMNKASKGKGGSGSSSGGHAGGKGMTARPFGDAINAATGGSGAVNEVGMLSHLVGSAQVAAGGILIVKTLHEMAKAMVEVHNANQDLEKSLGQGTQSWWEKIPGVPSDLKKGVQAGDRPVSSADGMRERRDELAQKSAAAEKSRGFWASMGSAVFGAAGNDPVTKSIKLQQDADTERLRLDAAIAGHVMKETEAREILVRRSQQEGELAKVRLDTEEKIATIRDQQNKGKIGPGEAVAQIKQAKSDQSLAEETINLKAAAAKREADQQTRLNYIRLQVDDASVKAALVRVDEAKAEVLASRGVEQERAARAKLDTAELEYHFAQKAMEEERRGQASTIAMAELRADADTRHMASLIAEKNLLDAKMNDARSTPDQKREYAVDLAKNKRAQLEAANEASMRSFDTAGSMIDAHTGVGQGEQQRALAAQIALEGKRKAAMTPEVNGGAAIAAQAAKVAQMKRGYDDVAHSIKVGQEQAKGQSAEMKMQLGYQSTLAAAVAEQHDYALKIAEAQRGKNQGLAEELEKQKQLALAMAVRKASDARQEANGLSLAALAKSGGKYGHRARQVGRLEQRADRLRASGRVRESDNLRGRANAARRGLEGAGVLKPSEANKDMAAQMDKSALLKAIKDNTEQIGKFQ